MEYFPDPKKVYEKQKRVYEFAKKALDKEKVLINKVVDSVVEYIVFLFDGYYRDMQKPSSVGEIIFDCLDTVEGIYDRLTGDLRRTVVKRVLEALHKHCAELPTT